MTGQKLQEVIKFYKNHLTGIGMTPTEFDETQYKNLISGMPLLEHCLWMLIGMETLMQEEDGLEKAMRWLGFVQGCLAMGQLFTIAELREHSRS